MKLNFARASNVLLIISIVAVAVVAGCIGQTSVQNGLYNITKDGVEYDFSNNIYTALNVSVYGKDTIYSMLSFTNNIAVLFTDNKDDDPYVATAAAELTSKLSKYYPYSQGRLVAIKGFEMSNLSGVLNGTMIEFRGPHTGANSTDVRIDGNRIVVEALNASDLKLVGDRLALVLFEDDLQKMGVVVP